MFENYVSPWMDEELHIMRDAVRKFFQKEFVPKMPKWEEQGFIDREAWLVAEAVYGISGHCSADAPSAIPPDGSAPLA